MYCPFLSPHARISRYALLPGYVTLDLQSRAVKATSLPHLEAQRLIIIRLIYSLVFVTISRKVSHISAFQDLSFNLVLDTFLFDPDLMDDRTSNASAITDSDNSSLSSDNHKFRDDVTRRDGICVMTGAGTTEDEVEACHIIPHAKGHQVCQIS